MKQSAAIKILRFCLFLALHKHNLRVNARQVQFHLVKAHLYQHVHVHVQLQTLFILFPYHFTFIDPAYGIVYLGNLLRSVVNRVIHLLPLSLHLLSLFFHRVLHPCQLFSKQIVERPFEFKSMKLWLKEKFLSLDSSHKKRLTYHTGRRPDIWLAEYFCTFGH